MVGLAAVAWLSWLLRVELVVLFAAVLFGVALYRCGDWLAGLSGLSHRVAVGVVYGATVLLVGAFVFLAGQRLSSQYGELGERIPAALESLESRLTDTPFLRGVGNELHEIRTGLEVDGDREPDGSEAQQEASSRQMRLVELTVRTLSGVVVWAVLAFFIAFDGRRYARAAVRLVPPEHREVADDLTSSLGDALPWWLVGRLASMTAVTLLTALGLVVLDMPLAYILAVIAGMFSFVPFVGPLAGVAPAILVALESAPDKLVPVLLLYAGVQFVESNVITPRIQQRVASVPPLLLISSQLVMGVVAGVVGVMFATPLVLAAMVTVQVVYLRHHLGEALSTPREDEEAA